MSPPDNNNNNNNNIKGPPYAPRSALLGGIPSPSPDIPISATLLSLFLLSAILNMAILQLNLHHRHKFLLSGVLFGFSITRAAALVMRIVWASFPHNARIAIASVVLANAGVILLFIVNLALAQRVLRANHPRLGWRSVASVAFRLLYASVAACLIMVVVAVVYSFFTLDPSTLGSIRDVQLFAVTFLAVLAFLPLPIVLLCLILPRCDDSLDDFGTGRMRTKLLLLGLTSVLLTLGAGFRAGVAYIRRPADNPAWFQHKACFYCFSFVIELVVLFAYTLSRFDRRFYVPDGSSARRYYSQRAGAEKSVVATTDVVDDERPRSVAEQRHLERAWESQLQHELEKREPA